MSSILERSSVGMIDLANVTEICESDICDKESFLACNRVGKLVVFSSSKGKMFALSAKRGQLGEICSIAQNYRGLLCMGRFGFGVKSNEYKWVKANAPLLIESGIEVPGIWHRMLDSSKRCFLVRSNRDCGSKTDFLEALACALFTLGGTAETSKLVVGDGVPLHWVREFSEELGFNLIVVRSKQTPSGLLREDFMYWLASDVLTFDGQRFGVESTLNLHSNGLKK